MNLRTEITRLEEILETQYTKYDKLAERPGISEDDYMKGKYEGRRAAYAEVLILVRKMLQGE